MGDDERCSRTARGSPTARAALDAPPDGLHPRREQAGRRHGGRVPLLPGPGADDADGAGRPPRGRWPTSCSTSTPTPRPPHGLPLPARRRLRRDHRGGGSRDRSAHPTAMEVDPRGLGRPGLQHRHEPGRDRRCRHLRAPAPARRAALAGRPELPAHHRPHARRCPSCSRTRASCSPTPGGDRGRRSAPHAVQVLERELVEPLEAPCLAGCGLGVEALRDAAAARDSPASSVGTPSSSTRASRSACLHLGVGAERRGALLEQQVGAHVGRGRVPHAVDVLGARGLVVEVARAVVAGPPSGPPFSSRSTRANALSRSPWPKTQVLVVLDAALAVEVDVEELAVPQRLGDAVRRSSARPSARARPRG